MTRIYYEEPEITGITSIRVYGSLTIDGSYQFIVDQSFVPGVGYVTLDNTYGCYYFYLDFFAGSTKVLSTEPVLAEDSASLILKIRNNIDDTDLDDPAFTDEELLDKIKAACVRVTGSESLSGLNAFELEQVKKLVMISCCYELAFNNAKYSKINLPDGIGLDKGQRVKHYLDIAKQLEKEYDNSKNDSNDEDSGDAYKVNVTKKQYFYSDTKRTF